MPPFPIHHAPFFLHIIIQIIRCCCIDSGTYGPRTKPPPPPALKLQPSGNTLHTWPPADPTCHFLWTLKESALALSKSKLKLQASKKTSAPPGETTATHYSPADHTKFRLQQLKKKTLRI
uniref:Uncharacterized protein n=1 Tax=Strigamia maritima TaxID=126957 RepID=T1IR14_STRMM